MLIPEGKFGSRVRARLESERVIWFTTVDRRGAPQPRPVWFLWERESFLIYSKPEAHKVAHLRDRPMVSLHFNGDGRGGDIVVFTGRGRVEGEAPPADQVRDYYEKYASGFRRIGVDAAEFARTYSVPIRVRPESLRGH